MGKYRPFVSVRIFLMSQIISYRTKVVTAVFVIIGIKSRTATDPSRFRAVL